MSCKIRRWGTGWRTHNFQDLQLNMGKCSPGTDRELSFCEWVVDWETLQWPRSWWERTGRLMWFWTDKQPLQKLCYTEASLPLSPFLGTILLCLWMSRHPQHDQTGKARSSRTQNTAPSHKALVTAVPTLDPSKPSKTCCNNIASSSSDSWRVTRQKIHSHKQL